MTTISEHLKCQFTEEELKDISKKLAYENKNFDELEDAKKSVTSEFTSKLNTARGNISKLSSNINNGYEYRAVDCSVELNTPEVGQKTIIRTDTGEIVRIETMNSREKQGNLSFQDDD